MSKLLKSKLGWLLAGIHLLTVLTCLLYLTLIDELSVLPVLIIMILTLPWWWIIMWIIIMLSHIFFPSDISTSAGMGYSIFKVILVFSALINAFILYWLGFLLTKAFNYLSSGKS
jgi:hypothetical protein